MTQTQLTKHVYRPREVGPFGLVLGQIREPYVYKNLYWHNKAGEWLGHGDLNVADLETIAKHLKSGELFVLLPESAFNRYKGMDYSDPGIDFIVTEAMLVVAPNQVYEMDHYGHKEDEVAATHRLRDRFTGNEIHALYLTHARLRVLLTP